MGRSVYPRGLDVKSPSHPASPLWASEFQMEWGGAEGRSLSSWEGRWEGGMEWYLLP